VSSQTRTATGKSSSELTNMNAQNTAERKRLSIAAGILPCSERIRQRRSFRPLECGILFSTHEESDDG
jgi:hypothetical protein